MAKGAKRHKVPRHEVEPRVERKPVGADPTDYSHLPPRWMLGFIDWGDRWGCAKLQLAELKQVLEKLKEYENLKWFELMRPGTYLRAKRIPIDDLHPQAKRRLRAIERDDDGALWELRILNLPRIWGIRRQERYYFLWWDPNHEVGSPNKKLN